MDVIRTCYALEQDIKRAKEAGKRVGFVPTMGAIHQGHLSLLDIARQQSDYVVASIFVNRAQFNDSADYEHYPRTEEADLKALEEAGVDVVYIPTEEIMYPFGVQTMVHVGEIGASMEGAHRPGHFDGMATIVLKLLQQVQPNVAIFGEKDYQQLCIIRQMVKEFHVPVDIIPAPTYRDEWGLALSSRNVHLDQEQFITAHYLFRVLFYITRDYLHEGWSVTDACSFTKAILQDVGFDAVEYVELCDKESLAPLETLDRPARLMAAVRLGDVRLIDNILVMP